MKHALSILLLFIAVAASAADVPIANVITDPGAAYADDARSWQGIPGIERAQNGRLWVTWYSGDTGEGDIGNYGLAATSGDEGKTWSKPMVIQGPAGTRIGDPLPWIDPKGRLWIFYTQLTKSSVDPSARDFKGTIAIRADDPENEKPKWSAPFLVAEGGILFGKPLVRPNGWLAPFCINGKTPWIADAQGKDTGVLITKDEGASWHWQGGTLMPKELWSFSEATIAPRRDGSIWMVMRTTKGLYESASPDEGRTWSDPAPMPGFAGTATRAHMRRLASGAFMLIYHDSKKTKPGRDHLTAWLSDDEGRTWPHQLLLDERDRVSYPDATQAPDGRIYLTYDHGRYNEGEKQLLVSIVSEEDIRAGKIVSPKSVLQLVVNQCSAYGNHADLRRETQQKGKPDARAFTAPAPAVAAAGTHSFLAKPAPWFATDEAKTIAANILSYQSDYGGWPKNMDLTAKPFAGQPVDLVGEFKPIFDNGATTDEVRFMARMFQATKEPRYRRAVENGIDYILIAQYPTGGWPQSYPPDAQYHRHITFNDDSMVRIMSLLQEIEKSNAFDFLEADRRRAVQSAFQRGVECILKCQIKVNDQLTAWCAQHDEIDLSPRPARRFELVSLSGAESVSIVKLLMSLDQPSPKIVRAIESAVAWLESARIEGWRVVRRPEEKGETNHFDAIKDPTAGPLWGRFYDLATNQPIFSSLDSKPWLGMENIGRARGIYAWTGRWPQALLEKDYPAWKAKLTKTGPGPDVAPWQPRVRIALAGDSTVKDEGGWGFGFKKRLGTDVLCENFAQGGQSSKSFRDSGWWQKTLASKPAYVLIQFGHNDGPGKGPNRETDPATTYPENLARFISEAREAGAKPILVTSLARRIFEKDGKLRGELAPYVEAARKVAAEQHVPLIDLYARSVELAEKLGPTGVEPFEPKILPKPPVEPAATAAKAPATPKPKPADIDIPAPSDKPRRDGTHLTARGSIEFGAMVAKELLRVLPESEAAFIRTEK
jgi:PelA/Pel-15E family pectate lyase